MGKMKMMNYNFTISDFLDILMEIERYEETVLKQKLTKTNRENITNILTVAKNIMFELLIDKLEIPNKKVFLHFEFDIADLLRDVLYLYTMKYFEKEEVLNLLNNLHDEKIVENFYQRI